VLSKFFINLSAFQTKQASIVAAAADHAVGLQRPDEIRESLALLQRGMLMSNQMSHNGPYPVKGKPSMRFLSSREAVGNQFHGLIALFS